MEHQMQPYNFSKVRCLMPSNVVLLSILLHGWVKDLGNVFAVPWWKEVTSSATWCSTVWWKVFWRSVLSLSWIEEGVCTWLCALMTFQILRTTTKLSWMNFWKVFQTQTIWTIVKPIELMSTTMRKTLTGILDLEIPWMALQKTHGWFLHTALSMVSLITLLAQMSYQKEPCWLAAILSGITMSGTISGTGWETFSLVRNIVKQKGLDEKLWSDYFHLHYVFGVFTIYSSILCLHLSLHIYSILWVMAEWLRFHKLTKQPVHGPLKMVAWLVGCASGHKVCSWWQHKSEKCTKLCTWKHGPYVMRLGRSLHASKKNLVVAFWFCFLFWCCFELKTHRIGTVSNTHDSKAGCVGFVLVLSFASWKLLHENHGKQLQSCKKHYMSDQCNDTYSWGLCVSRKSLDNISPCWWLLRKYSCFCPIHSRWRTGSWLRCKRKFSCKLETNVE